MHKTFKNIKKALSKKIQQEVKCIQMEEFWNNTLGLIRITPREILQNIFENYRNPNIIDIKTEKLEMTETYNPERPMYTHINKIKMGRDFSW